MRIRSLKPEYLTDRVTGRWPLDLMMFYSALWCIADDEGRFDWEPEMIRAQIFPFHPELNATTYLERLVEAGRVRRYVIDGAEYGVIVHFKRHQRPNHPTPSRIPAPSPEQAELPMRLPESSRSPPVVLREDSLQERRGEEGRGDTASPVEETPKREKSLHARIVAYWCDGWLSRKGEKYVVAPGDGPQLKALLAGNDLDEPELRRRIDAALDDPDPFVRRALTLRFFCTGLVSRYGRQAPPKDALREFLGMDADGVPQYREAPRG